MSTIFIWPYLPKKLKNFCSRPHQWFEKSKVNLSPYHVCQFAGGPGCMCPAGCLLAAAEICRKDGFLQTPHSRTHTQQRRYQQRMSKKGQKKDRMRVTICLIITHLPSSICVNSRGLMVCLLMSDSSTRHLVDVNSSHRFTPWPKQLLLRNFIICALTCET